MSEAEKTPEDIFTEWRSSVTDVFRRIRIIDIKPAEKALSVALDISKWLRHEQAQTSFEPKFYRSQVDRVLDNLTVEHPQFKALKDLSNDPRAFSDIEQQKRHSARLAM